MLDFVGPDELCLAFLDQLKTVVEKLPQGEETPGRRFVISRLVFMTHGIFRDEGRVGLVVLDTLDAHATLDLERAFKPQVISKTIQVTGEGITVASVSSPQNSSSSEGALPVSDFIRLTQAAYPDLPLVNTSCDLTTGTYPLPWTTVSHQTFLSRNQFR